VSSAWITEPLAGAKVEQFVVRLSAPSSATITVDFATQDGSAAAPVDYTATSGTLVFEPGATRRRVRVDVIGDGVTEGRERYFVLLQNASGATVAHPRASGHIRDPKQYSVPVSGAPFGDVVVDPTSTYAFATNTARNVVNVLDLRTGILVGHIRVGSEPLGLDITPDGSTLYVANSGAWNVSVVDVASREQVRRIKIDPGQDNELPRSVAVASNGKAFLTQMDSSGSGHMLQIDLVTDQVSLRSDFGSNGRTIWFTRLDRSPDHAHVGIVEDGISNGPVFSYTASTDTFSAEKDMQQDARWIAVDARGSRYLVDTTWASVVLDASLDVLGTIQGSGTAVAVRRDGRIGYRLVGSTIEALDLQGFAVIDSTPIQDGVHAFQPAMAISPDGKELVIASDTGFTVQQL
jgi:YVTN family beta-propeller protein